MNTLRTLHLLGILFLVFSASAQEKFLTFEEVVFESAYEKQLLTALNESASQENIFNAFLAIALDDSVSYQKWKDFYFKEIDEMKGRKVPKKIGKDVKYIYDQLHEKFLRKYQYLAYFDQVFENGVYNCVTAVALYALSFEELGIPYQIKETPTHVYIVADPQETQLLIETTDPISGFKTFSPGFKENYVSQLAMMKLVDQADVSSKGIYPLFDEYYFGGAALTLKQLVGIQYYNLGVSMLDEKDYQAAWSAFSKAQLFHSTKQLDDLLFVSLVSALSGSNYSDWEDIKLLPYMIRFDGYELKESNIVGEFNRMLSFALVDNNNTDLAERGYNYFIENSDNEKINNEVTYYYYFEKARIAYNRGRFKEAFDNITLSYDAKPESNNSETLLVESFRLAYRNKSSEEALHMLDSLTEKSENLASNNHFQMMKLNLCLSRMAEDFDSRKPVNGTKMMERFETSTALIDEKLYDPNILGDAYSKAAVYYFKRGYTTKARGILNKGLKYAPNSYELKSRLRMISR